MHVRKLRMVGFMAHADETLVDLPERGLVVVMGPNGAGKSSVVEAVATAVWGRTLRGTSPWREGEPGEVHLLLAGGFELRRTCTAKGTKRLRVSKEGQEVRFDSASKAQSDVVANAGDFDLWRRTHVFSSQDAAHFTLASDGERKRLLEQLLGLGRFDAAYARCRDDRNSLAAKRGTVQASVAGARARFEAAEDELRRFEAEAEDVEPELVGEYDKAAHRAAVNVVRVAQVELEAAQVALDAEVVEPGVDVARLEAEVESLESRRSMLAKGQCPVCHQKVSPDRLQELSATGAAVLEQVQEARQRRAQAVAEHQRRRGALRQVVQEAGARRRAAEEQVRGFRVAKDHHELWQRQHAAWAKRQAGRMARKGALWARLSELERILGECEDAAAELEQDLAVLDAVSTVLGLRGVRAQVLSKGVEAVDLVAARYMAHIAGEGLRLHLRSYSEQTSGVVDKISLEVEGAGGGHGYKGSSGGERRRIDTAVLLSLAEVSAATAMITPGTLFMDEVFDALDEEGCAATVGVLCQLAESRCVVVITHNRLLAEVLPATVRLHVEAGRVS